MREICEATTFPARGVMHPRKKPMPNAAAAAGFSADSEAGPDGIGLLRGAEPLLSW